MIAPRISSWPFPTTPLTIHHSSSPLHLTWDSSGTTVTGYRWEDYDLIQHHTQTDYGNLSWGWSIKLTSHLQILSVRQLSASLNWGGSGRDSYTCWKSWWKEGLLYYSSRKHTAAGNYRLLPIIIAPQASTAWQWLGLQTNRDSRTGTSTSRVELLGRKDFLRLERSIKWLAWCHPLRRIPARGFQLVESRAEVKYIKQ
jgi:hypothetical protein